MLGTGSHDPYLEIPDGDVNPIRPRHRACSAAASNCSPVTRSQRFRASPPRTRADLTLNDGLNVVERAIGLALKAPVLRSSSGRWCGRVPAPGTEIDAADEGQAIVDDHDLLV